VALTPKIKSNQSNPIGGLHGKDCMVVGFPFMYAVSYSVPVAITNKFCEFDSQLWRGELVLDATLYGKTTKRFLKFVCGGIFWSRSPNIAVRYNITEIFSKKEICAII